MTDILTLAERVSQEVLKRAMAFRDAQMAERRKQKAVPQRQKATTVEAIITGPPEFYTEDKAEFVRLHGDDEWARQYLLYVQREQRREGQQRG